MGILLLIISKVETVSALVPVIPLYPTFLRNSKVDALLLGPITSVPAGNVIPPGAVVVLLVDIGVDDVSFVVVGTDLGCAVLGCTGGVLGRLASLSAFTASHVFPVLLAPASRSFFISSHVFPAIYASQINYLKYVLPDDVP